MSPDPWPGPATYGHPLAYVRALRGWSATGLLEAIADSTLAHTGVRLARADRNKVHRWETRGVVPELATQRELARLLGVAPRRLATHPWPRWLPGYDGVSRIDGWWPGCTLRAISDALAGDPADPRGYLALTGARLRQLAQGWLQAPSAPSIAVVRGPTRVPEWTAGRIERHAAALRELDQRLGAAALAELVAAQLRLVAELLATGSYSARVARRLYLTAADLGHLAGWLASAHGRHFVAQRYFRAALHAAHSADERTLGGYLLVCLGYQAVRLGHGSDAVRLAEVAVEAANRSPSVWAHRLLAGHLRLISVAAGDEALVPSAAPAPAATPTPGATTPTPGATTPTPGATTPTPGATRPRPGTSGAVTSGAGEPGWARWLEASPLAAFTGRCYEVPAEDPGTDGAPGEGLDLRPRLVRVSTVDFGGHPRPGRASADAPPGHPFRRLHALAEQLATAPGVEPDAASLRSALRALLPLAA